MRDDALVRFTAHELTRADLQPLMVRANGPALRRAVVHFGMLALTGTLIWNSRATGWVVPLIVVHGYMVAFVFCALHETAHRTAFRTRWLNVVVGHLAGLIGFCRIGTIASITGTITGSRRTWSAIPSCISRSRATG